MPCARQKSGNFCRAQGILKIFRQKPAQNRRKPPKKTEKTPKNPKTAQKPPKTTEKSPNFPPVGVPGGPCPRGSPAFGGLAEEVPKVTARPGCWCGLEPHWRRWAPSGGCVHMLHSAARAARWAVRAPACATPPTEASLLHGAHMLLNILHTHVALHVAARRTTRAPACTTLQSRATRRTLRARW